MGTHRARLPALSNGALSEAPDEVARRLALHVFERVWVLTAVEGVREEALLAADRVGELTTSTPS